MEAITVRTQAIHQALLTLEQGIERLSCAQSVDYVIIRDGVIQRFEYCIDLFWKFLKLYIETQEKRLIENPSPRSILKLAAQSLLITQEEHEVLIKCIADRNITSHTYNEELAIEVQRHIPVYLMTMKTIVARLTL